MAVMFANGCFVGRRALKDADTMEKDRDKTLRRVAADRAAALAAHALEAGRAVSCADTVAEHAATIVEQAAKIVEQAAKIALLEAAAAATPAAEVQGRIVVSEKRYRFY